MPGTSYQQLIPIDELTPGQVGKIRNDAISFVVGLAARELSMSVEKLVVRDIRPEADLGLSSTDTGEHWVLAGDTASGYSSVTGDQTMADQRFACLFGVRQLHSVTYGTIAASVAALEAAMPVDAGFNPNVSLIKINVGGADKIIWDMSCLTAYEENKVAFTPSAIVIPQNASYNIRFNKAWDSASKGIYNVQLIGVVVEPRGKVVSP